MPVCVPEPVAQGRPDPMIALASHPRSFESLEFNSIPAGEVEALGIGLMILDLEIAQPTGS